MEAEVLYYIAGSGLAGITALWAIARTWRLSVLHDRAKERIGLDCADRSAIAISRTTKDPIATAELGAISAVTAAEFAWEWATIDSHIIQAADFSSTAAIQNGFQYAQYIHDHMDKLSDAAKDGFLNRLAGYVGEQHVADILRQQGHTVQLAETANQPVWDLLVDGHAANVKTVANIASIKEVAAAHPDVIYYVPDDSIGDVGGNIVHLQNFDHDSIKESLQESLAAAKGDGAAQGLLHHLPWITIGFAAYRNVKAVQKGKDPLVAFHHILAESVGKGIPIVTGGQVGGWIGSPLGPIGTFVGAVVGGLTGAFVGSELVNKYKQLPLKKAQNELCDALQSFGSTFACHLEAIRDYLNAPVNRLRRTMRELGEQVRTRKSTLRWIIWPDFYTVLLEETAKHGGPALSLEEARAAETNRVLREAEATRNFTKLGVLMVNSPAVRELVGFDPQMLDRVTRARARVFFERKQLNPDFVSPDAH